MMLIDNTWLTTKGGVTIKITPKIKKPLSMLNQLKILLQNIENNLQCAEINLIEKNILFTKFFV